MLQWGTVFTHDCCSRMVGSMAKVWQLTWQPFFTRRCAQESVWDQIFGYNPRSLLDVIEWLVGIQECLECHNILLPSYTKPLMWWWSYEWPQLITWQPFFTRRCAQFSVWDQMNLSRNGNIYASRNRYKCGSYDSPTYLPTYSDVLVELWIALPSHYFVWYGMVNHNYDVYTYF